MPNDRLTLDIVAQASGQEQINALTAALNRFSDSTASASAAGARMGGGIRGLGGEFEHTVPQMAAASAAVRAFEGTLSVRAVERFLTGVLQIGPALQTAFPVIGALAFGAVLLELGQKINKLAKEWDPVLHAEQQATEAAKQYGQEIHKIGEEIRSLNLAAIGRTDKVAAGLFGSDDLTRKAQSDRMMAATIQASAVKAEKELLDAQASLAAGPGFDTGGGDTGGIVRAQSNRVRQAKANLDTIQQQVAFFQARASKEEAQAADKVNDTSQAQKDINDGRADDAKRTAEEYARQAEALERQVAAYEKIGRLAGATPIDRIISGASDARSASGLSQGQQGRINNSEYQQLQEEIQKLEDAQSDKKRFPLQLGGSARTRTDTDDIGADQDTTRGWAILLRSIREYESVYDEIQKKQGVGAAKSIEGTAAFQSRLVGASGLSEAQQNAAQYQIAVQAANAKYESELKTASLLSLEKEQEEAMNQAEIAHEADLQKAKEENILKTAELQQKQLSEFKSGIGGLFDAAVSRNPRAISDFLKQQMLGIGRTITENLAAEAFPAIRQNIPHAGSSSSALGKILQGTPFGAQSHTLKTAGVTLNDAGVQLQTAAQQLASIGGGSASGGSLPASWTALPGLGGGTFAGSSIGGLGAIAKLGGLAGLFGGVTGSAGVSGSGLGGLDPSWTALPGMAGGSGILSGKNIAGVAGIVGGGLQALNGFGKGGAGGALSGVGGILDAGAGVAALTGVGLPVAAGLAIAGGIASMIGGFLNNPQRRENAINKELTIGQYQAPTAINMTQSSNGTFADFDARGNIRTSNFSPYPEVVNPSLWANTHGIFGPPTDYYNVPGRTIQPYGPATSPAIAPAPITIYAMDAQSFHEFAQRNSHAFGEATATALQNAHGRLTEAVQYVAR